MREFISRKAAVEAIVLARDKRVAEQPYGWEYEYAGFNSAILVLPTPTEDVRPVVRGEWGKRLNPSFSPFDDSGAYLYMCNQCGHIQNYESNFCPNCGADMREVLGDE